MGVKSLNRPYERRHSRWYEVLLLSPWLPFLVGAAIVVLAPPLLLWPGVRWSHMGTAQQTSMWSVGIAFLCVVLVLLRVRRFSAISAAAYIFPVVTTVFLVVYALLFFTRSRYARSVLLLGYGLTLAWCYAGYFFGRRYRRRKLAFVPMGVEVPEGICGNVEIRHLTQPDLEGVRYDGVVADLRSHTMTPEWEKFLAQCILAHIPVFHARLVLEELTGQVELDHLLENQAGSLVPSPVYSMAKRVIDVCAVILSMPIVLPIMALTAITIRMDSTGPALFIQERVGMGGGSFRMYKFRSMLVGAEKDGNTRPDDERITRVGRFIRHTRIDELPQFFNVLRGDMSLIGPRAEWRALVDKYEQTIPFYSYRHVVRPGISGWAQVTQGYTGTIDEAHQKAKYDLYYIKHFSMWLDLLITLKTLKVIVTGLGAR